MSFTLELFEEAIPNVLADVRRVLRIGGRVGIVAMSDSGQTNAMIDLYEWLHRRWPHFIDCRPIDVVGVLQKAHFHARTAHVTAIWAFQSSLQSASKHRTRHNKVRHHDQSSIQDGAQNARDGRSGSGSGLYAPTVERRAWASGEAQTDGGNFRDDRVRSGSSFGS